MAPNSIPRIVPIPKIHNKTSLDYFSVEMQISQLTINILQKTAFYFFLKRIDLKYVQYL
jgi:hypothetical protein